MWTCTSNHVHSFAWARPGTAGESERRMVDTRTLAIEAFVKDAAQRAV